MNKYIGISRPLSVVRGRTSNLDAKYGPYDTLNRAILEVPEAVRRVGLTVGIITIKNSVETVDEYWWKEGISDDHLVKKAWEFKDLSEEEKDELKLYFEDLSPEEKNELKLKFEDLTPSDKLELKGAKGDTGDHLTVRKTYQTEAEALADKNPIDTATSLPLTVGQFISIVDDGTKNGIYRISSIGGDGTMSLELQGKLGDLSDYANHGYPSAPKTLKEVEDDLAQRKIDYATLFENVPRGSQISWRIGSFMVETGLPTYPDDSTTRIRSLDYTTVRKGDVISLNNYSNHKFMVFKYSSAMESTFLSASEWNNSNYVVDENCFVKFLIAFTNDAVINEGDIISISNMLFIRGNKINGNNLSNGSIDTEKLSDKAVTLSKLNNDALDFINTHSLKGDDFTFERASITVETGSLTTERNHRLATRAYTYLEKGILTVPDFNEVKVMVFRYTEPNESSYLTMGGSNSGWLDQDYIINSEGYYRFVIAYADDRIISEDEVLTIGSLLTINTPLTQNSVKEIVNDSVFENLYDSDVTGWDGPFEIGTINNVSGRNALSENRIRSVNYSLINKVAIRKKDNVPYKFCVYMYHDTEDTAYAGFDSWSGWLSNSYEINEFGYYRIVIAHDDDRSIEESEISEIVENFSLESSRFASRDDIERIETELRVLSGTVDLPNVSDLDFVLGSIYRTTGERINATHRIIVDDLLLIPNSTVELTPPEGTKAMLFRYDYNKSYISSTNWLTKATNINVTDDTYYISLLFAFTDDREILEEDIPLLITGLKNIVPFTSSNSSGGGGYYFRGETVPAIPVGSNALGYDDFMEQTWETLRTEHPDYITREVVIRDTSDEYDIYEYTFTPEHYDRTVFLVTGIHGDEYEANWGLYYFMKYVTEESHKYERLRDLYHNVRFVVIPILSPWGVENRTRATSRVDNANNNYDIFHRAPEYDTPNGTHAFSENEALAVKLVADKYNAEFDFFADFHTDRYDPHYGNYMIVNQLSSALKIGKELIYDEADYLKEDYGFDTTFKPKIVNINRRSSSFKYMEAVRGVPSALLEVGTGRLSPIGSSLTMTVGVDWFTNIITEMLKEDLTQPKQPKNALEQSILENRLSGYSHSVTRKIPDENIQVFLDRGGFTETEWRNKAERASVGITGFDSNSKTSNGVSFNNNVVTVSGSSFTDFTLVFKATITGEGILVGSDGDLNLTIVNSSESGRYNISNGSGLLYCSALRYNEEVSIGIKSENNVLSLYVNGEPFNSVSADHSLVEELYIGGTSGGVKMNLDTLVLYNRPLRDDEIGFVFKSFITQ